MLSLMLSDGGKAVRAIKKNDGDQIALYHFEEYVQNLQAFTKSLSKLG